MSQHLSPPTMEKPPPSESKPSRLSFPNEFPYEFDSPAFSPGFTSPGDSTETEDESSSDDEEDFLAGLTRRLPLPLPPSSFITKPEVETSPRLSQLGSFSFSKSRNESPYLLQSPKPTTSFRGRDNAWDVISAAAGEVAKLKLYEEMHLRRHQNAAFQSERYFQQQQQRLLDQVWLCSSQSRIKILENQRHNGLPNATWQPRHAGAPVKRASAGTGVFLPRRYPTTTSPSESLKKPLTVNATMPMLQTKVKQTQSLNFDEFVNVGSSLNRFENECMLARSTLLARQRNLRGVVYCQNQERLLPQDWMY